MSFFKGYVRTRQKKCIDKFKDAPLKSFREVRDLDEYAGILDEDTVLIDIDNKEQAEKLLDIVEAMEIRCQVRETTRGMHFYFKNDGSWKKCATHATTACGLMADVKVGLKASYAILKFGGQERDVIYDIYEDETYQAPPVWLKLVHTNINLFGLGEGDGRNDKLFKVIMPMQDAGMTRSEIVETLDIVNRFIFKKPLSQSEFDTVTRDEAFQTALVPNFFTEKGQFLFDQFALYMINQYHIKRVNGQLHVYDEGVYVSGALRIERLMLDLIPTLSKRQRSEAFSYMEVMCTHDEPMADVKYVAFANGILDLNTGALIDFSPEIVITNKINWDYREDAYNETVDKVLDKISCFDKEIRSLLEEAAGYCLFRRNELRKAFVLTGDKSNGKSTYINMLGNLLGDGNISALDLNDLSSRFRTAELFGKLANLGDDIGENFIDDVSIFKKLVSGDKVMIEHKGEKPFFFSNYAKFIFSANALPRVKDRTQAVLDRMIIIPFNATFSSSDADFDPFISDKLKAKGAIEYLVLLGVEALKRIRKTKKFTSSAKVIRELKEYNEENNPILVFTSELSEEEMVREPVSYWYSRYGEHCLAYGCTPISRIFFSKTILREFPDLEVKVRCVGGKNHRFFVKKD